MSITFSQKLLSEAKLKGQTEVLRLKSRIKDISRIAHLASLFSAILSKNLLIKNQVHFLGSAMNLFIRYLLGGAAADNALRHCGAAGVYGCSTAARKKKIG